MSKRQVLMVLGVWVIILPFLGFPSRVGKVIAVISGAVIVLVAYSSAPRTKEKTASSVPFVEHRSSGEAAIGRDVITNSNSGATNET